jgi:hypothetical protein
MGLEDSISQTTMSAVRLRPASFEDHRAIANLMGRYNLEKKTAEEWRHLWEGNPELIRLGGDWPIGWVLEHRGEEIVGYFGNIPVAYEFQRKRLTAAATHAWVVDTAHRNSTILLVHRYFNQKTVDLFVDASANYEAGKVFEAMHGHRTPSPRSDVGLFWVIDHPRFVSSLLKRKGIRDARVLEYLGGGLVWAAGHIKRQSERLEGRSGRAAMDIQFLTRFDERFDELWQRLRLGPDLLRCVRDSQTLTWHFRYALARREAWIVVALEGSSICAYSIFLRQDNRALGLKRVRLVDFQALPGRGDTLPEMISAALVKCRPEGVHMLESIGFGRATRTFLESLAPHRRRLPAWMFFYKARDKRLDQQLSRPELWDVCSYDGEGSLEWHLRIQGAGT